MANLNVSYVVPLVAQTTGVSCWAAALAMLVSYRDAVAVPYSDETIAAQAGMSVNANYSWDQIKDAVAFWNLQTAGPACATPQEWADLLQQYGPIWLVKIADDGSTNHVVLVVSIAGDGTTNGTRLTMNNPSPVNAGSIETKTFIEFENDFELAPSRNGQMVHKRN